MIQLEKTYEPKNVEPKWIQYWNENGLAKADESARGEAFSIVIPPPNITGSLHIGHAFNNTLQDILTRWKRMLGCNTLWQPGTDHAGIATQNVVERQLKAKGQDRHDLGREAFVESVWKWKEESGSAINRQLVRLGGSMDWTRDRFTMDEGLSKSVREVFVSLYEDGLVYKGDYIINWCPRCHTAISDLEVEYEEKKGKLYYLKYYFEGDDDYLTIATTRPETLLGDTAVAVNPKDERYIEHRGKKLLLPVLNRAVPLIEDNHVDISFGTGALKVTPAHDPNDFEIGRRHDLPSINVMNEDASINSNGEVYEGLDRYECRKRLIEDMELRELIVKIEDHVHSVGHCYRCQTVIEPYLSKQWFIKAKTLAIPAIEAVRLGKIKIVPKHWESTYFEWMENIRDWCVSRQIWWGHQIPAWTCSKCGELTVARETPTVCSKCYDENLIQETDVLDTWFSSALWPFSTLGWPEKTKSLEMYYPTSVLCTGFDILFFWVARMVMMGLRFMGDVPFQTVYIHALIRDSEGQKMSKTKGNVIDPLLMMDKYGTDALRFTLAAFAAQGRDIKLAEDRIEGYRNFCNKLWNASRFIFMNLEDYDGGIELGDAELGLAERNIFSKFNRTAGEVNRGLEEFKFNEAASVLYKFVWNEFCDWYIEEAKTQLARGGAARRAAQNVLLHVLERSLRLLHPFIPFITEEIWQKLPGTGKSLMIADFPKFDPARNDLVAEAQMKPVRDIVSAVRNIRGEMNINPGIQVKLFVKVDNASSESILENETSFLLIRELARVSELRMGGHVIKPAGSASSVWDGGEVYIPLEGLMDFSAERKRVEKELNKVDKDIQFLNKKLSNANFVDKAPPEVITKDRGRLEDLNGKKTKLLSHLKTVEQGLQ
tara:strand:+ start:929 stop:3580 length:2652 start_codon:yes stop_codon:yes gene_type:complete